MSREQGAAACCTALLSYPLVARTPALIWSGSPAGLPIQMALHDGPLHPSSLSHNLSAVNINTRLAGNDLRPTPREVMVCEKVGWARDPAALRRTQPLPYLFLFMFETCRALSTALILSKLPCCSGSCSCRPTGEPSPQP